MSVWFVSRHAGAQQWAADEGFAVDHMITHLEPGNIIGGDVVIGSLPVNLAAEICARGARYMHLSLPLPPELRGKELSAEDMRRQGATLQEYRISAVAPAKGS
jgi:CRISPR-associated protein Csx16